MRFETLAVHAGQVSDPVSRAVAQPLTLSVTFEREADGSHAAGYYYSAKGNPNRAALETALAALEGASDAITFSSGCAAISAVLRTLRPGDHVLVPDDVFQGTVRILREALPKWSIAFDLVSIDSLSHVARAMRPNTRLVWAETLSNPLLKVADIQALSDVAHAAGALLVVDNTFVTPVFQRPLDQGADLVVHSTTKYIAGHGDALGGVVVGRADTPQLREIRQIQLLEGAIPAPFDCWLIRRGIETLAWRMYAHARNAMAVAEYLTSNAAVREVFYPGLTHHPGFEIARRQLSGGGGIVSFRTHGGRDAAFAVAARVKVFTRATSLGGPQSLIQHQATAPTHGTGTGLHEDLLRLAVGLEHPDDLIEDLEQALAAVRT